MKTFLGRRIGPEVDVDLRLDVAGDPDEVVDDGLLVGVHRLVHLLRLELRVRVDLLHDVVLRPHELGLVLAKLLLPLLLVLLDLSLRLLLWPASAAGSSSSSPPTP